MGRKRHDRWRFKIPLKLHSQGRNIDRAVIGQRHLDEGIGAVQQSVDRWILQATRWLSRDSRYSAAPEDVSAAAVG